MSFSAFFSTAAEEVEPCPTIDEMLLARFVALGNRQGDLPEEDLRLLEDTVSCGANGYNTVIWLRGELHCLQQRILHKLDDYAPHAEQVQRWAQLFNRLAPYIPKAYVRFQQWSEIDSIDWELQTELETIVWSDFKCHCAVLN